MGDPFTPPDSSSATFLSWLFPQPPAKSSLPRHLLLGEMAGEYREAVFLNPHDGFHDGLKDDAASKEQAIAKIRIAAFIMASKLLGVGFGICRFFGTV